VEYSKYVTNNVKDDKEETWQKLIEILLSNYSRVFREPEQALR
jgi:chemotaxis methyl-accepting protein methylase